MQDRMTTWVAVGGHDLGDAESFVAVERPVPAPGPGDLLVRVQAVSINPVDTKVRAGLALGATRQLGWDAAGTVEAVGEQVTRFRVGDEVWYAGDITRDGTNTELHLVDERIVGRRPRSLSWSEAAAMPLTAITAWESLFDRMRLTNESSGSLLVLGGAGGVGSVLIQLAKALTGVSVIATASRAESRDWVKRMGADFVIDHHDLVDGVRDADPDGVKWVFTPFTAGNVEAFAEVLQPFGHVVAIDEPAQLDLRPLKAKSIAFHWELMFTRPMFQTPDMSEQGRLLDEVARLVDAGTIQSSLTTQIAGLGPESLRRGHQIVAGGHAVGKIALDA